MSLSLDDQSAAEACIELGIPFEDKQRLIDAALKIFAEAYNMESGVLRPGFHREPDQLNRDPQQLAEHMNAVLKNFARAMPDLPHRSSANPLLSELEKAGVFGIGRRYLSGISLSEVHHDPKGKEGHREKAVHDFQALRINDPLSLVVKRMAKFRRFGPGRAFKIALVKVLWTETEPRRTQKREIAPGLEFARANLQTITRITNEEITSLETPDGERALEIYLRALKRAKKDVSSRQSLS